MDVIGTAKPQGIVSLLYVEETQHVKKGYEQGDSNLHFTAGDLYSCKSSTYINDMIVNDYLELVRMRDESSFREEARAVYFNSHLIPLLTNNYHHSKVRRWRRGLGLPRMGASRSSGLLEQ